MKITGAAFHGTYETARGVASLSAGIGWVVAIVGGILVLASLPYIRQFGLLGVSSGILIAAVGLLQVTVAQGARAAVDSADYARQTLKLQIAQAEGLVELSLRGSASSAGSPADARAGAVSLTRTPPIGSVSEQEFAALDPSLARAYIEGMRSQQRWQEQDALLGAWYRAHRTNLDGITNPPAR